MTNWLEYKISAIIAFIIIFLVTFPSGYVIYRTWNNTISVIDASANIDITIPLTKRVSASEKIQIEKWLRENNLNQYGDPAKSVYTGGTPLFNESSGQTLDLYQYILSKHPDRPWKKS